MGSTRVLVGALIAALAAPSTAAAITRTIDYGQPGTTQARALRGWWNPNGGKLRMPARYVGRSPQSPATQTVCAELVLYQFTDEYFEEPWAFDHSSRKCVDAAPGKPAHFPTWRYTALAYTSYNLEITITWRVRGGAALASALYDYDGIGDYRCQTKNCASAIRHGEASIRFDS